MKKTISVLVENQAGVLNRITSLFSRRAFNIDSLAVGVTDDPSLSRITIIVDSGNNMVDQVEKQLNKMVEVIKVLDFTDCSVCMKELLYVKVKKCSRHDKEEVFHIAEAFVGTIVDYGKDSVLVQFLHSATKNDAIIKLMKEQFQSIEVVRGGSVGIEAINMTQR